MPISPLCARGCHPSPRPPNSTIVAAAHIPTIGPGHACRRGAGTQNPHRTLTCRAHLLAEAGNGSISMHRTRQPESGQRGVFGSGPIGKGLAGGGRGGSLEAVEPYEDRPGGASYECGSGTGPRPDRHWRRRRAVRGWPRARTGNALLLLWWTFRPWREGTMSEMLGVRLCQLSLLSAPLVSAGALHHRAYCPPPWPRLYFRASVPPGTICVCSGPSPANGGACGGQPPCAARPAFPKRRAFKRERQKKVSTRFAAQRAQSRARARTGPPATCVALRAPRGMAAVRLEPGVATSGQLRCGCMRSAAHITQQAAEPHVSLHAYNEKRGVRICQTRQPWCCWVRRPAAGHVERAPPDMPAGRAPVAGPETPPATLHGLPLHIVSRHELAWANLH